MNNKHLNDYIKINEDNPEIKVGDLVSEYTRIAIEHSANKFSPTVLDYQYAHEKVMEQYKK